MGIRETNVWGMTSLHEATFYLAEIGTDSKGKKQVYICWNHLSIHSFESGQLLQVFSRSNMQIQECFGCQGLVRKIIRESVQFCTLVGYGDVLAECYFVWVVVERLGIVLDDELQLYIF